MEGLCLVCVSAQGTWRECVWQPDVTQVMSVFIRHGTRWEKRFIRQQIKDLLHLLPRAPRKQSASLGRAWDESVRQSYLMRENITTLFLLSVGEQRLSLSEVIQTSDNMTLDGRDAATATRSIALPWHHNLLELQRLQKLLVKRLVRSDYSRGSGSLWGISTVITHTPALAEERIHYINLSGHKREVYTGSEWFLVV